MLLRKSESSLEEKKIVSLEEFYSSKSKSSKKKESLQDNGSDTKFRYQILPWISLKVA